MPVDMNKYAAKKIRETSGPTILDLDAIADGEFLKRVGTKVKSAAGGGGSSPLTTKGDLHGFDTADDRVPVGSDGDVLTADSVAALGVSWQPPAGGGGADIGVRVFATGVQSIPNATFTPIAFDSVSYDPDGIVNLVGAPTRFTVVHGGKYFMWGSVQMDTATYTIVVSGWRLNGSTIIALGSNFAGNGQPPLQAVGEFNLSPGDYVEYVVIQFSGGAANTVVADYSPLAGIRKVDKAG